MAERVFEIAGFRVGLNIPHRALADAIGAAWSDFASSAPPEATIAVEVEPGEPPAGARELPEPRAGEGGALIVSGPTFEAVASPNRTAVRLRQRAERYPVETVVKLLLAERLLAGGGLLVHGVGLATSRGAAVFTGPSGAGKSTLGGLCRRGGLGLLADELVAIAGDGTVFGTPWNTGQPARSKLMALGLLAFAPEHRVDPIAGGPLMRVLLPNALMADPSPAGRARMFHAAAGLIESARAVTLGFSPDDQVAWHVRALIEGG